jgi:dephospho-CoA kinase
VSSSRNVPFVGLTGGIGAGKSTALAALERLGATTLSTDQVVHQLYETPEVRDAVLERFGTLDRGELARRAFANREGREWLESLLWPKVGERMRTWRSQVPETARAAVVEVPLLFESGLDAAFDATIAVIADEQVRARRAGARGHEALAERSDRQLTQQEKAGRATYTVLNDGTVAQLERKLSDILAMLER